MSNQVYKRLAYNETLSCVQCGYCLPSCPTYLTFKKETHSPRGRINLVKMAAEGRMQLDELKKPIELCLGCRACETVCPTNVAYGTILESAKHVLTINEKEKGKKPLNWVKDLLINKIIPNNTAMNVLGETLHLYEKTKLKKLFYGTKLIHLLPERLATFENIISSVHSLKEKKQRKRNYSSIGKPMFKVAFFKGCIMDTVFQEINMLSIKLLAASGCDVTIVDEQTCCGAIHSHSGEMEKAKELAKKNIIAFEKDSYDFIVNSIGGCGAMLVEYNKLFEKDIEWKDRAKKFANKNKDISFVLSKCQLPFKREIPKKITYQPSCHMSNVQKNIHPPLDLIKSIPGISFVLQKNADSCCGSAGTYNLIHYDESMKILDEKMKNIKNIEADMIVTTNPGCHLQMKVGVERINKTKDVHVCHLVELLAEACDIK